MADKLFLLALGVHDQFPDKLSVRDITAVRFINMIVLSFPILLRSSCFLFFFFFFFAIFLRPLLVFTTLKSVEY